MWDLQEAMHLIEKGNIQFILHQTTKKDIEKMQRLQFNWMGPQRTPDCWYQGRANLKDTYKDAI